MKRRKHFKYIKNFLLILISVIFITGTLSTDTEAKKDKKSESNFTGHWQIINSMSDIPSCGYVLLGYAKDTSKLFYGSLDSTENKILTTSLDKKLIQIDDTTDKAFMLIQDKESFYIQLANKKYLKISGDLTNAVIEETDKLEEASAFRIEMTNHDSNGYAYYRIFIPVGLSDLSLTISNGKIALSSACHSGFYIMAEATKIKEPPFGNSTKTIRFIATIVVVALVIIMLYLYHKNILNLITFGISTICIIALLVFFMIFAITSVKPGLYVLRKSTFNATQVKPLPERKQHKSYYEIIADGSAIFSFEGDENNAYIWGCSINDSNVFTTTSSGNYTSGLYTILLRPFSAGTYDIVFYYYDVTKGLSTTIECKTFRIVVDETNKITSVEQVMGEV